MYWAFSEREYRFNAKSSKYHKFILAFYGIFRKLSYLCHPEFRCSLYIAKYSNEQKLTHFQIVTCFIQANAQLLDIQSKPKLKRVVLLKISIIKLNNIKYLIKTAKTLAFRGCHVVSLYFKPRMISKNKKETFKPKIKQIT